MTTKDKLTFVHAMARLTRATVRQCEALMRYAGTLALYHAQAESERISIEEYAKYNRIQRKVTELCGEIKCEIPVSVKATRAGLIPSEETDANHPVPLFAGPVLKIRTPGGEEIEVPS